jgi:hypothetical protein
LDRDTKPCRNLRSAEQIIFWTAVLAKGRRLVRQYLVNAAVKMATALRHRQLPTQWERRGEQNKKPPPTLQGLSVRVAALAYRFWVEAVLRRIT